MQDDDDPPALVEVVAAPLVQPSRGKPPNAAGSAIPVTIITGFLGAGKTTFLKKVLQEKHGMKILVIQNEYGEDTGVEKAVLLGGTGTGAKPVWVDLPNGCICCSAKDGLVRTVEEMVKQRRGDFELIVVETDGLADPAPVAAVFWQDEAQESNCVLDGVIAIVDAKHLPAALRDPPPRPPPAPLNPAQRQLALADRILLNKCDLVSAEELELVERQIRSVNSVAPILRCVHSQVPLQQVLHLGAFNATQCTADLQQQLGDAAPSARHHSENCSHCEHSPLSGSGSALAHTHDVHEHTHAGDVRTVTLTCERPLHLAGFQQWLARWLWSDVNVPAVSPSTSGSNHVTTSLFEPPAADKAEVLRGKGIIWFHHEPQLQMLQAVRQLWSIDPTPLQAPIGQGVAGTAAAAVTKLVFIGRNLPPLELSWRAEAPFSNAG
jgi:G3E family GTPase